MIENLNAEVAEYRKIIDNINLVIISLNDSKNELIKANTLVNYFAIDGSSPDDGEIKINIDSIQTIISSFTSIISEIQVKINTLEEKIREEMERIRREQEAGLM